MRLLLNGLFLALLALPAGAQSPAPSAPPPRPAAPVAPPSAAAPGTRTQVPAQPQADTQGKIDLNTATAEELQTMPGIGPARAAAIVAHRPYRSADDMASKASIPQSVLAGIRGRLTAMQVNVNTADRREMIDTLPGIGEARAEAIIRSRPYARPEELVSKAGVPQTVFDRIRHAITLR